MMKKTESQKAEDRIWKLKRWGLVGTKKRAAKEFQQMIRWEAADSLGQVTCVTCGFKNHWTNSDNQMHAGHFVSGRTNSVLFVEATETVAGNCHPQCSVCNRHRHGNQERYAEFMEKTYGKQRVIELSKLRGKTVKFDLFELDDMRLGYRARSKAAKKRLENG